MDRTISTKDLQSKLEQKKVTVVETLGGILSYKSLAFAPALLFLFQQPINLCNQSHQLWGGLFPERKTRTVLSTLLWLLGLWSDNQVPEPRVHRGLCGELHQSDITCVAICASE